MFEIVSTFGDNILAFRHRGPVTDSEFVANADMVADLTRRGDVLVLLDWVGIKDWAFSAPVGDALLAWRRAAKTIRRIAIVHDPRLNRPAAWLGAVMRQEGVTVRSWRPEHAARAVAWLQTDIS